jgi:hypothetical protein
MGQRIEASWHDLPFDFSVGVGKQWAMWCPASERTFSALQFCRSLVAHLSTAREKTQPIITSHRPFRASSRPRIRPPIPGFRSRVKKNCSNRPSKRARKLRALSIFSLKPASEGASEIFCRHSAIPSPVLPPPTPPASLLRGRRRRSGSQIGQDLVLCAWSHPVAAAATPSGEALSPCGARDRKLHEWSAKNRTWSALASPCWICVLYWCMTSECWCEQSLVVSLSTWICVLHFISL